MAYDEQVAQRLRRALEGVDGVTEKRMFGGIAFMVGGHMSCGVVGEELMVRVGPEGYAQALAQPHTRVMDFTGKPLRGFVYVAPEGFATDQGLRAWVRSSLAFVTGLAPKQVPWLAEVRSGRTNSMDLEMSFHEADSYLLVQVAGSWTAASAREGIAEVAKAAREKGFTRILLDVRGLSPPSSELVRFLTGIEVAKVWGPPVRLKVAAVYRPELINKFLEDAAVNRGADFTVLSDIDEALEWLIGSPTSGSS